MVEQTLINTSTCFLTEELIRKIKVVPISLQEIMMQSKVRM